MSDPTLTDAGSLPAALARLRATLRERGPLVVAFSGGADSAFLAWVAHDELGPEGATAITAVSPSLPHDELEDCRALAAAWGLTWSTVLTDEADDPAYRANDADRCYHCKEALAEAIGPIAAVSEATVALGVNVDDLGEHRPGQRAALEHGAVFPLVEAGFSKAMVRDASRQLGLRTADKPAAACLASRVPYGTAVTVGVLRGIEAAEASLRRLGFTTLRVRHYGDTARIEVPVTELGEVVARREAVATAVHDAGYRYATLDLDGFRSGNLNDALDDAGRGPPSA